MVGRGNLIIGLSGKKGSGKTTAANYLRDHYGFKVVSFAEKLKEHAEYIFPGIVSGMTLQNKEKQFFKNGETRRSFLIKYGQFVRYFDEDYWAHAVRLEDMVGNIVIDDLRFPNEVTYLLGLKAKLIRIKRYPKLNIYGPEESNDPSETALDEYKKFDYTVDEFNNIEVGDLYKQMDAAIKGFRNAW